MRYVEAEDWNLLSSGKGNCGQFEFGLRFELMMHVAPPQERVFEALVEKTKICEQVNRIKRERNEQRQQALVYVTRRREDRDAANMIEGSALSNLSCVMVDKLGIRSEETVSDVTILSPLGQSVRMNKIYWRCRLQVQGEVFLSHLMEFPFGEFDLIIAIDWLSENRVSLDCDTKCVTLRTIDGNEIIMIEEHQNYLSNVISTLVANNLIHKGCEAYLAYILDTKVDDAVLENIHVVKEFLDIFSEDLPCLPLECEVEFRIELLVGTVPVSIAPYCMALKELKELKV
ncbi:uncharacterized protein [Gossypium hirsutum]|uniref:RVP_2 domain-containing protein n=1 Tax=Gossypium hirsutum TaxID=3635 RepID=A0A1U8MUI0_GOSHI|nr:uncharacterized protein LOC107941426 [Gossypium hirsutum]